MTLHRTPRQLGAAALALSALLLAACNKPAEVPPPPVITLPAAAAPETTDIDITQIVKTALLNDEMVKGFDITVVTTKGDVRLTGVLDTQDQIDQAMKVARAAEGAHTIHDELTLKK